MVHVSQLGRLGRLGEADASGYDLSYSNAAFDAPSGGNAGDDFYSLPADYVSAPKPSENEWAGYTNPAAPEDGLLSFNPAFNGGSSEKTVVTNTTSDDSANKASSSWLDIFKKSTDVAKQIIDPYTGLPISTTPPPATGMSGSTIALIGLGAVAVLGIGYAVLAD